MKLQILLAVRGGALDAACDGAREEAQRWRGALPAASRVVVMKRLADDPLAHLQPPMRPFEVALEAIVGDAADGDAGLGRALTAASGLAGRLDEAIHADLSLALAGRVHSVLPPGPTPTRYLYVMRRKAGTTHEQYIDHYVNVHAEFGRRTPAIEGYEQFHVDEAASRAVAEAAGLGGHRADSVSELSIPDLDDFMRGVATSSVGREALADEVGFVDRASSVGCCMEVL